MEERLAAVEQRLGLTFTNRDLLRQAITHRSWLNENRGYNTHYEVLEFLGDAVLELLVREHLVRALPGHTEGTMTNVSVSIVNHEALARIVDTIGLEPYLLLSRGQSMDRGKSLVHIKADVLEAILAAIYIDQGFGSCRLFADMHILPYLPMLVAVSDDDKSALQEKTQSRLRATPEYRVHSVSGPDHNPIYQVGIYIRGVCIADAEGNSKKDAEKKAARIAIATMKTWERRFLKRGNG